MTIEEARAHIGDGVVYTPAHGEPEDGVITSVNDRFVFVRYGSRQTSAATEPDALFLLAGILQGTVPVTIDGGQEAEQ